MSKPSKKKVVMRRFGLSEISGVNKPAQEFALATITKKDISMDPEELMAQLEGLQELVKNQSEAIEKQAEQLATMQAKNELAEKVARLNDSERSYYEGLDKNAKDEFLAKSQEDRQIVLNALVKDDPPIVYKSDDGITYTKNDDARLIELAKRSDTNRRELLKVQQREENMRYEKRASEELQYLPGSIDARAMLLKAVDAVNDESMRNQCLEILKSHNDSMKKNFQTVGTNQVHKTDIGNLKPSEQINELVKQYMEKNSISETDAYELVRKEHRSLVAKSLMEV